ncbi:hypothetical protein HHK36_027193 [Tetracentron sinense]|uniref:Uncharacterized protein n=1 Tax=Tetracentron sinense TaxID=13715 RepID=A0A835D2T6_TETSI|nr:hypothetical protein HHK36_027193 [Tetracentron sinense]
MASRPGVLTEWPWKQLGNLKGEEVSGNGELYVQKHLNMKIRVVDGSSLAVADVLNSSPKDTEQVFQRGNLSKVAYAVVLAF